MKTNLPTVECDGGECESGDVQGAVLYKSTDVTHRPPKHPGAVHEPDLREHTIDHVINKPHSSIKTSTDTVKGPLF